MSTSNITKWGQTLFAGLLALVFFVVAFWIFQDVARRAEIEDYNYRPIEGLYAVFSFGGMVLSFFAGFILRRG